MKAQNRQGADRVAKVAREIEHHAAAGQRPGKTIIPMTAGEANNRRDKGTDDLSDDRANEHAVWIERKQSRGVRIEVDGLGTWGLFGEAGYQFLLDGWEVTPKLGLDITRVHTDAFGETGGFALDGFSSDADRLKAWLGVAVSKSIDLKGGRRLELTASAKVSDVVAGRGRSLPVSFGGTPMTDEGLTEGQYQMRLGGKAKLVINPQLDFTLGGQAAISDVGSSAFSFSGGVEGHF